MGLWMHDIVNGKVELPPDFARRINETSPENLPWDYHDDLEKEKTIGLMNKKEEEIKKA